MKKTMTNSRHNERVAFAQFASQRIGPHNIDVLETLIGNLLGDSWGEQRVGSSRFHVHMSTNNMEYLHYLHAFFRDRQYCSENPPKINKLIGKRGKIYYSLKFRTYSYSSLNWLMDMFYPAGGVKTVPADIGPWLNPRTLAIWFMGGGGICGSGCKISTDHFSKSSVEFLAELLGARYGFHCTLHKHGKNWILYFPKGERALLSSIIKEYMVTSMYYKLNGGDQIG